MASKQHMKQKSLVEQMERSCLNDNCDMVNKKSLKSTPMNDEYKQRSNNNEEDYENNYANELPTSGRISGGSRESAFSSVCSDGDETSSSHSSSNTCGQLDSSSDNNSSSGRSSANRDQSLGEVKILNPHCNIMPESPVALALVETIRVRFLDSLKEQDENLDDLYDKSDLEHIRKPIPSIGNGHEQSLAFRFISRYINFLQIFEGNKNKNEDSIKLSDKEINEAVEKLKDFLKFRHHFRIPSATSDQFSKEFYMLSGCFQFGVDKQNIPILYLRARVHRRWSHDLDESFRRYVGWQVDRITKSHAGVKVSKAIGYSGFEKDGSFAICFDCLHVSYSCLDMDFLRFLVSIMVQYYPTYCRYALCVDLPWLFRSVWKLVQSWLPEDARNSVQLITSKQLTEYIDADQIPNSMKINDLKASEKPIECRHQLPADFKSIKGIEEFAKELSINSSELKQFKAHVEKVQREYETLGAV